MRMEIVNLSTDLLFQQPMIFISPINPPFSPVLHPFKASCVTVFMRVMIYSSVYTTIIDYPMYGLSIIVTFVAPFYHLIAP